MANLFRSVRGTRLKRNAFNLSHDVKLTTDFGRLTPILCKEVVPGDVFKLRSEMLIRTAPLFAPLMHRVNAYVHYYYVPSRILMKNFETFITGGEDGTGRVKERFSALQTTVEKPYATFKSLVGWFTGGDGNRRRVLGNVFGEGSLFDYLGFPALDGNSVALLAADPTKATTTKIDLLPFKAYHLIYNEYYRDQNFEDEIDILKDVDGDMVAYLNQAIADGASGTVIGDMMSKFFLLHQRNWEKDYFTSALPWPQRGDETTIGEDGNLLVQNSFPTDASAPVSNNSVDLEDIFANVESTVNVPVTSINELRRALAVQKFRERLARYGSRYTEFLRGVFGVTPKDSRLQRPEFLGGFKQQLKFGEVLQTSETTESSPQGAYAGTGFSLSGGKYIKRSFDEHGYIIGILSIMPKPSYMQGWPREFTRFDKLDYYVPDFAHLGEQDIRTSELVWSPTGNSNGNLFGYIPRYAEYKFSPSRVCGLMRSNLDFWHLARRFGAGQNLNQSFLEVNRLEMDRVFNYQGDEDVPEVVMPSFDDHFWLQVYHDIKAVRPMPKFGTPLL